MKRNVILLSLSQAVLTTGTSMMLTSSAIVGMALAQNKSLVTLPLALLFPTQMATTIPASLFMAKVGRRFGFMTSAMVGYGVMNFIMIATPLAMKGYDHAFADTAFVIQWHVFSMFVPSFFSGHLIRRFGTTPFMLTGVLLLGLCILINFTGITLVHFWSALVLLGVGWNFLFVGATTLLTDTYSPGEKAKAQALNDFIVFGTVTITSFSSGAVQHVLGWQTINVAVIPFLVITGLSILWLKRSPSTSSVN